MTEPLGSVVLGSVAKFRKATTCVVMPVFLPAIPSVRRLGTTRLPLDGLSRHLIFEDSSKICRNMYVEFTHQQMHLKKHIKIYIKMHINIAPTCFGLRPSSGSLH